MLSNNKLVYLITGANRGIGLGILTVLAARPDTVVFAGCLKMSLADEADNAAAIAEIENKVGRLDVVIANAAVPSANPSVATLSLPNLRETFEFNTVGMVVLYQAAHKLLLASPTGAPIFAYISSSVGSLASHLDFHMTSYGVSKAASNFIICELHAQNPSLIAMAIHPGWVQTKMGNEGARGAGMAEAPTTVEDSVAGVLSRIDGATREKSSGKFWNFKRMVGKSWDIDDDEVPW